MKILITGAKGQLGRMLKKTLEGSFELILTDREEMDITDSKKVMAVILKARPDIVIHAAAYVDVERAEDKKKLCRKINVTGSRNIAKAAAKINAIVIYISTDYVFDGKKRLPYKENDKTNPLSVYAKSKLDGEKQIEKYCPKRYILRTAWLVGKSNQGRKNFIDQMIALAQKSSPVKVVDDQTGSLTYAGDLAFVIKKIISRCGKNNPIPYSIYNFSSNGAISRYDLVRYLFSKIGTKTKLEPTKSKMFPAKAQRPPYSYLNKEKIKKTLKIKIRPWQEMLDEYLKNRST